MAMVRGTRAHATDGLKPADNPDGLAASEGVPRGMNATDNPDGADAGAAPGLSPAFMPGSEMRQDAHPAGLPPAFMPGSSPEGAPAATPVASAVPHPQPRVGAMPDTRAVNFYDADPHLRFLLCRRLAPDELALGEPLLRALGARLGGEIEDLAADADRHTPELRQRDKRGERVDEIVPSRAYRDLER